MADLADLFSAASPPRPSSPPPPRSPSPGPSREALFLSPGLSIDTPQPHRRSAARLPSPPRQPDLFAERIPDLPAPVPAPSKRAAESDWAFEDPFKGLNDGAGDAAGGAEEGGEAKKRRVMAKVDADRLMGERGIPALMKLAKGFKPKGKGHEASDLRALLSMYQLWAHGMFPKGDFAGTIQRVEHVCRTRRMENALKGYHSAFYPPPPSPTPPPLSPSHDLHLTPPPPSSPQPPRLDGAGEDEPDLDEMMALEAEMDRERAGQQGANSLDDAPPILEEEDEWEGLYD